MTTDLHNLTRDQLERLASGLLQHVTDGDDQETTLRGASAILSEPRPEQVKSDREVVEEWVLGEPKDSFVVGRFYTITDEPDCVRIQLGVWREASFFPDYLARVSADTLDAAYAAAAEWVRRQSP